ncbi:MAG: VOC family protein, partial [Microcoleus sp.]
FDSPFIEKNGLLEFNPELIKPEFLSNWTFEAKLYGEIVSVDHFVITFPNRTDLENYAASFFPFGAKTVEGPDLFPINFCAGNIHVPSDLWLHLMTLLMPASGLVVLDAPHAAGDQKDRFQQARGLEAVHHVAIRVKNVQEAATIWQNKNFKPLSDRPLDYGSLTQWFLENPAGQIIELIERHPGNNATFDCKNIAGLRLSESQLIRL